MAIVNIQHRLGSYEVRIEPGLLDRLGAAVRSVAPHARCALIADGGVFSHHGERAMRSLEAASYAVAVETQETGEVNKTLETVRRHYDALLGAALERRSPVVALGGGVVGDSAGFVAATYLRGLPFVQCPTSLLAMVDASVGGKVGVNLPQGKNLVGSFYQPALVAIDPEVLRTLPARELRCGLAECIKHGVIRDAELFDWTEHRVPEILALEPEVLTELIQRNVGIKAAVVAADEREQGQRAHLNFGHTFAHAIEHTAGYGNIRHGEAVALGMLAASRLAAILGLADKSVEQRLRALLQKVGLPIEAELASNAQLYQAMTLDKKVADGKIRFVLPTTLGAVTIHSEASRPEVDQAWNAIRS